MEIILCGSERLIDAHIGAKLVQSAIVFRPTFVVLVRIILGFQSVQIHALIQLSRLVQIWVFKKRLFDTWSILHCFYINI